jgi:hypothetical protein
MHGIGLRGRVSGAIGWWGRERWRRSGRGDSVHVGVGVRQRWDGTCDAVREGIAPRGLGNAGRWNLTSSHLELVLMLGRKGIKFSGRVGGGLRGMKGLDETDLVVEHRIV